MTGINIIAGKVSKCDVSDTRFRDTDDRSQVTNV